MTQQLIPIKVNFIQIFVRKITKNKRRNFYLQAQQWIKVYK
jgi:hypothetical protein